MLIGFNPISSGSAVPVAVSTMFIRCEAAKIQLKSHNSMLLITLQGWGYRGI